ncbi:DUF6297 family protein [Glutamicibacter sp. NPDC087344]|uniref:DUF6297 family protein n=1 Tax=Glutamicibacter sp. NPDC087344 TaxID=3363994 RepID=UPI0037FB13D3
MNADTERANISNYNPGDILHRVRARRSFAQRFDVFSEIYIWVLAAVVALAYLSSALYGAVFVLLSTGVAHLELGTARWGLNAVVLFALPMLMLLVFRLMLYLGPNALEPQQADWWLPLPVDRLKLLRRPWWRSLGLGVATSVFLGLLWVITTFALTSNWSAKLLVWVVGFLIVFGLGAGAAASLAQSAGRQRAAIRFCSTGVWAVAAVYLLAWTAQLCGLNLDAPLAWMDRAVMNAELWIVVTCIMVLAAVPCALWATRRLSGTPGAALRTAGLHQQQLAGALMQGDLRGIDRHRGRRGPAKRGRRRLGNVLPVAVRVLVLRSVRGGYWKPVMGYSLAVLVLLLSVLTAANALVMTVALAILLLVLNNCVAEILRPAATQPELGLMLGIGSQQLERALIGVAATLALLVLGIWTLGLFGLGMLNGITWWAWGAAVVLAALGLAAASLAHARRAERDWEEIFAGAANELSMASVLIGQLWTVLRAVAAGAVLYFLLLTPQLAVPWGIWVICLLGAVPAVKKLAG